MPCENGEELGLGMGALVKRYRENQRFTQQELTAAARISLGALRDLEQDRTRYPRWAAVVELAAVLAIGQTQHPELTRGAATIVRRPGSVSARVLEAGRLR